MDELTIVEKHIIEQFRKNSGIKVNTDRFQFMMTAGPQAAAAPGCYQHEFTRDCGSVSPEMIWYTPRNQPGKGIEVFFHEMAHATASRIGREIVAYHTARTSFLKMRRYAVEEIIAETTAMKLLNHFNMMTPQIQADQAGYIDHWSTHKCWTTIEPLCWSDVRYTIPPESLHEVEVKAQAAFEYIINNWLKEGLNDRQNHSA